MPKITKLSKFVKVMLRATYVFYVFFKVQKAWLLRFSELLHTFSQTFSWRHHWRHNAQINYPCGTCWRTRWPPAH